MKNLSFFLILFISANIFPQKFADTLNVVAGQKFNVPKTGAFLVQNIVNIYNKKIQIYDNDGISINLTDKPELYQKPSTRKFRKQVFKDEGRGHSVIFWTENISFHNAGSYIIEFVIPVKGEIRTKTIRRRYLINVDYPTLAAPFTVEKKYFIKQNVSFSFATNEYNDPNKYSYTIRDKEGEINIANQGSLVNLDTILQKDKNYGKVFTITGFYDNAPFFYQDSGKIKESKWDFQVIHPTFRGSSPFWSQNKDNIRLININNKYAQRIYFLYEGNIKPNTFIAFTPNIKWVNISSEPAEFLLDKTPNTSVEGIFSYLIFPINQNYINKLDEPLTIKITLEIGTQFGVENLEYYTKIVNCQQE